MKHPILHITGVMWKYAKGLRHRIIAVILLTTIANFILLLEPYLIGRLIDFMQGIQSFTPEVTHTIYTYLFLVFLVPFGFWAFHGPSRLVERRTAFLIRINYNRDLINQVFSLPVRWHRYHHSGESIDKINKATRGLYDFAGNIYEPLQNIAKFVGAYAALTFIEPVLGVIAIIITGIGISVTLLFDRIILRQYQELHKKDNRVASSVHDYVSNIITVISLRIQKIGERVIVSRMKEAFPLFKKNNAINEWKWFTVNAFISLMIFLVLAYHVWKTLGADSTLLLGTFYTIYAYLNRISETVFNFAWLYGDLIERGAAIQAAETITESFQELDKMPVANAPANWKAIQIKKLHFRYIDETKREHHVENIHLNLAKGKKVALVGHSGGGKSTTLSLIRGLHHTNRVNVEIDGEPMKHGLQHLYNETTLLPQEPEVFADTIEFNITLGQKTTPAKLKKVIELSQLAPVIKRLSKGIKTNIAEKGVNLSGGEKQRLALARGLLIAEQFPILLMDEPTSSVDPTNELKIMKGVFEHFKNKAIVASIHRLHLLNEFDYIYLIENGKLVEEGTLKELLKKKGELAKQWTEYHASKNA